MKMVMRTVVMVSYIWLYMFTCAIYEYNCNYVCMYTETLYICVFMFVWSYIIYYICFNCILRWRWGRRRWGRCAIYGYIYMYIYIYTHVCISNIWIYEYIYIYIFTYLCSMYVVIFKFRFVNIYICVCVYVYLIVYEYIQHIINCILRCRGWRWGLIFLLQMMVGVTLLMVSYIWLHIYKFLHKQYICIFTFPCVYLCMNLYI
jgi:hypothetical protein